MKKFSNISKITNKYNLEVKNGYILVVYHPTQFKVESLKEDFRNLFSFLQTVENKKIWIAPNNDAGSSIIKSEFLKKRDINNYYFDNLPREEYLTLLKNAKLIIGNSSSGIIESPAFKIPCINLGHRQKGRLRAKNVIDVSKMEKKSLIKAYKKSQSISFRKSLKNVKNPYGDGNSSMRIINWLKKMKIDQKLIFKKLTY